ncbi:MAG: MerR family transcriptional regulator, partial [Gemmatimonadales bacterium]
VQQTAERTGLSEHTLRYYERAGLLRPVRRHDSSGHRRYSTDDVARIATLACLRATGLPLDQMRRYFTLAARGAAAAPELRALLEEQQVVLEDRLERMRRHLNYVKRKIAYWRAVEAHDDRAAADIARELTAGLRPKANGASAAVSDVATSSHESLGEI